MKRTVGIVVFSILLSILLSSAIWSGASLLAASTKDSPQSPAVNTSSLSTSIVKKKHKTKKHKLSKLQKKRAISRARAIHNAKKRETHVAHMRHGLKKIAKHHKKVKTTQVAATH